MSLFRRNREEKVASDLQRERDRALRDEARDRFWARFHAGEWVDDLDGDLMLAQLPFTWPVNDLNQRLAVLEQEVRDLRDG